MLKVLTPSLYAFRFSALEDWTVFDFASESTTTAPANFSAVELRKAGK